METTKDEIQNSITTGDVIVKRHGFKMEVAPLSNWPSEDTKFIIAEEVEEIAKQLISKFRDDLKNINIGYVFKKKATKSGEFITMGEARSQNDLQKVLHGIDAIIVIGFDTWLALEPDQKFRLVFHELEHIGINFETGKVGLNSHLVEEFPNVVKYFGLGQTSHVDFIHAYNQFSEANGR